MEQATARFLYMPHKTDLRKHWPASSAGSSGPLVQAIAGSHWCQEPSSRIAVHAVCPCHQPCLLKQAVESS